MEQKIEYIDIELELLELNEGQVPGLPKNPRQCTYEDIEHLKNSIQQTPELLELRGLIVYPLDGKYVVIGGNMRLTALRSLGWKSAPCIVIPYDTEFETLAAIAIKDNGSFGMWDKELLEAEWDDCPLAEWGIDVADFPSNDTEAEEEKDKTPSSEEKKKEISIVFSPKEFDFVNCRLRDIDPVPEVALLTILGYYGA